MNRLRIDSILTPDGRLHETWLTGANGEYALVETTPTGSSRPVALPGAVSDASRLW